MRQVAVLGIGQTVIGEHWDKSLREIAGEAAFAAMHDSGLEHPDGLFVGNMLSPLIGGQNQLGTFIADWVGMWRAEAVKIEAACASGAAAFRAGVMAVAAGEMESALVVGVEKMTDKAGHDVTAALATAADADYEVEQGISFVSLNALIMRRYMYEFGWKHIDGVAANAELAAAKVLVIALVLHANELRDHIALTCFVAGAQSHDHAVITLGLANAINGRDRGHNDHVAALHQTLGA